MERQRQVVQLVTAICALVAVLTSLAASASAYTPPQGLDAYRYTASGHGSANYAETTGGIMCGENTAGTESYNQLVTWSFSNAEASFEGGTLSPVNTGLPPSLEVDPVHGSNISYHINESGSCPSNPNDSPACGTYESTANTFTLPIASAPAQLVGTPGGTITTRLEPCPYMADNPPTPELYVSGPSAPGSDELLRYCTADLAKCNFPSVMQISGSDTRTFCQQGFQTAPDCEPPEQTSEGKDTWQDTSDTWQLTIDAEPLACTTTLGDVQGDVTINGQPATVGMSAGKGDVIATGGGSRVEATNPDGSTLRLGPNSSYTMSQCVGDPTTLHQDIMRVLGHIWGSFSSTLGGELDINIETDNDGNGVRGGVEEIDAAHHKVDVRVDGGHGYLRHGTHTVQIPPGYCSSQTANRAPTPAYRCRPFFKG